MDELWVPKIGTGYACGCQIPEPNISVDSYGVVIIGCRFEIHIGSS